MTDDNQADTQAVPPLYPTMHKSTFQYLKPTEHQMAIMERARKASAEYAAVIEALIPAGPDKTYMLRKFREVAMWANIAITRNPDGSPRQ